MTNNQIIRNEAARLDPATLHAIATAHHTPDEIAAIAAACKTTDENGNEQPATVPAVGVPASRLALAVLHPGQFCRLPEGSDSSLNGISLQW